MTVRQPRMRFKGGLPPKVTKQSREEQQWTRTHQLINEGPPIRHDWAAPAFADPEGQHPENVRGYQERMAHRNLNTEQLKMFMSPREIRKAGYRMNENEPALKKREADRWGMTESIKKTGVQYPISLAEWKGDSYWGHTDKDGMERMLVNGHHRFFAQEALNKDQLMPVIHAGDPYTANNEQFEQEHRSLKESPDLPSQYIGHGYVNLPLPSESSLPSPTPRGQTNIPRLWGTSTRVNYSLARDRGAGKYAALVKGWAEHDANARGMP